MIFANPGAAGGQTRSKAAPQAALPKDSPSFLAKIVLLYRRRLPAGKDAFFVEILCGLHAHRRVRKRTRAHSGKVVGFRPHTTTSLRPAGPVKAVQGKSFVHLFKGGGGFRGRQSPVAISRRRPNRQVTRTPEPPEANTYF